MSHRFTVDGGEILEKRIAEDMELVRTSVLKAVGKENIAALILGGGYGRGEGGVCRENGEETTYNDYDFFVIVPSLSRRRRLKIARTLADVGHALSREVGIDVDFSPPIPSARLRRWPYELMMMELKEGHRVLHGSSDIVSKLPDYDPAQVPLHEGARLLMNRGVGLLLSRRKIRMPENKLSTEDRDFVTRNIHKAVMAMGDAVLMTQGKYSPSYVQRSRTMLTLNLEGVPGAESLRRGYVVAIHFKLRPYLGFSMEYLRPWTEETIALYEDVFLWFERIRLNAPNMTWRDYSALPTRMPDSNRRTILLNVLRNIRLRKSGRLSAPVRLAQHPRDALLAMLPPLLYSEGDTVAEGHFLSLWNRFN